jgi:HAD superfamily hydrolase (TIGR01509 family)
MAAPAQHPISIPPMSFVFDLDGTLVDSVYQHVLAWHEALRGEAINLSVWRIHRKIGMSGTLLTDMLFREIGVALSQKKIAQLQQRHKSAYARRMRDVKPLPGAIELLRTLSDAGIGWAIASSGRRVAVDPMLEMLKVNRRKTIVITRDDVEFAKPNPDLFLAAMKELRAVSPNASVIGDSVWDMLAAQRAGALGIGVLSGGYGTEELSRSGAYRVFEDPQDLLVHLDELGARR